MPSDIDEVFKLVSERRGIHEPLTEDSPHFQMLSEHTRLLKDGGFIEAWDASTFGRPAIYPKQLTYEGAQFLEHIRDESTWGSVKGYARDNLLAMLPRALFEAAKAYAQSNLPTSM